MEEWDSDIRLCRPALSNNPPVRTEAKHKATITPKDALTKFFFLC